ncbi:FAD:protein FMN transferase [Vibrio viridaestus]|uniref:FAD:protein FMN transferase n=1 Tax=Vibrio viridaestus TaxID=2487322 RepID=A0A3N9TK79_9VIBR|nr:FAD:protein FMN transferase [Vibrio viridaestus]RQW64739.1 FAD:protein FMN transferase [Vibrio viridaestus]
MSVFRIITQNPCIKAAGFVVVLLAAGCSKQPEIKKIEGFAQGTTYHISWWSDNPVEQSTIKSLFSQKLASIDKELSTYRDDSYISEFNHSKSTEWQPASDDFIQLLHYAQSVNQKTDGCYDPTVGPLFNLWGFKKDVLHVPSEEQINAVRGQLGLDKIEIDEQGKRIRKTNEGVQLDFSSMGEGYTIGKLSQILEDNGITNYLVEFGGDMKIRGHKPGDVKWRIAIEKPISQKEGIQPYQLVTINDESGVTLDTSGTYHHSFDENGKEYPHILDLRTGAPVNHNLVSASVFGSTPALSDAWATAMLCLGPKEGAAIANKEQLEVFFIQKSGDNFTHFQSKALASSTRISFDQK